MPALLPSDVKIGVKRCLHRFVFMRAACTPDSLAEITVPYKILLKAIHFNNTFRICSVALEAVDETRLKTSKKLVPEPLFFNHSNYYDYICIDCSNFVFFFAFFSFYPRGCNIFFKHTRFFLLFFKRTRHA